MARSRHVPLVTLSRPQWIKLVNGRSIEIDGLQFDGVARRVEIRLSPAAAELNPRTGRPLDPPEAREFLPPRRKPQ
jgi:hypothetical protein